MAAEGETSKTRPAKRALVAAVEALRKFLIVGNPGSVDFNIKLKVYPKTAHGRDQAQFAPETAQSEPESGGFRIGCKPWL
jgi:hypothetical protein